MEQSKTLHAALYILGYVQQVDFHKIFKILYFADQGHLKRYGRSITGEEYNAMEFGPVPSFLYDVFKSAQGGTSTSALVRQCSTLFQVENVNNKPHVRGATVADLDTLSESDLEILNAAIRESINLSFNQLVEKSHDLAWIRGGKNKNKKISYLDMAEAVHASVEMRQYIQQNLENESKFY